MFKGEIFITPPNHDPTAACTNRQQITATTAPGLVISCADVLTASEAVTGTAIDSPSTAPLADARGDALARPKGLQYALGAGEGLKTVLTRALKCPCHEIMHSATRPIKRRFHIAADQEAN